MVRKIGNNKAKPDSNVKEHVRGQRRNPSRDRMFVSKEEQKSGYQRKTPGQFYSTRARAISSRYRHEDNVMKREDRMLNFLVNPKSIKSRG